MRSTTPMSSTSAGAAHDARAEANRIHRPGEKERRRGGRARREREWGVGRTDERTAGWRGARRLAGPIGECGAGCEVVQHDIEWRADRMGRGVGDGDRLYIKVSR